MYCPRCAVNNVDDASFCRACGANISLVPQALTGRLPEKLVSNPEIRPAGASRRGKKEPPGIEKAVQSIFIGIAFLLICLTGLLFFRGGFMIWIWFIIPALANVGQGIGQFMRLKREDNLRVSSYGFDRTAPASLVTPVPRFNELPPRDTAEILGPPTSVTEGTTRHLDAPVTAKPHGASTESSKEV